MTRWAYERFDERTWGAPFDASELFDSMSEDLFHHGDVEAALRRLIREGFHAKGKRLPGLREILNRARQRRETLQRQVDPNSTFAEYERELEQIIREEKQAINSLREAARKSGDPRRQEVTEQGMAERELHLDLLPDSLPGKLSSLSHYEFVSSTAHEKFQRLLDKLRQEVLDSFLQDLSRAAEAVRPQDLDRMREALASLNDLIERHNAGEDVQADFKRFKERYGDMFPSSADDFEGFIKDLARHMMATSALVASMSPEQRAVFEQLAERFLSDLGLQMEATRLAELLRAALPELPWDEPFDLTGAMPASLGRAQRLMQDIARLRELENILREATGAADLAEVDLEGLEALLGPDAVESLSYLRSVIAWLKQAGLVEQHGSRLRLTPRGMRRIGEKALGEIFARLRFDKQGAHVIPVTGGGGDDSYTVREYRFGDPFDVDVGATLKNSLASQGAGLPVRLRPEDIAIRERERNARAATVLALDLSLSMPMRENFVPAKKVAMALHALISTRFPKDFLGLVGFSEVAHEIRPRDLPSVSWDFVYGTNIAHALQISRAMLERQPGSRQIILITDGEPTAHITESGEPFFSYPPTLETVRATLAEVVRCTKAGIKINTFLLGSSEYLSDFVARMTAINGGRAFYTSSDDLGRFVMIDFVSNRTKLLA